MIDPKLLVDCAKALCASAIETNSGSLEVNLDLIDHGNWVVTARRSADVENEAK